jgi:eight-cysteine-cluster-containing protein
VYWYDSCGNKESKKQACEYGCKDGACKPAPAEEDFCGNSTLHECSVHSECVKSGCSGQVCAHAQEEIVTTCEYRNCYKASEYGLQCGCFDNRCQWSDEPKCAGEGELTSGPVSPEYQFGCCSGLESFYPHPEGFVGAGNLCYDPAKGVPVCMGNATDDEGWYYPDQTLLREGDCAPPCYDSDGGDNKWVKGTMTFNGSVVGDDFCYPAELGELYGSVGESYCVSDGYGTATSVTRECPSGCYDGACLPEGSPSCSLNTTDSLCPEYCDNETDSDC